MSDSPKRPWFRFHLLTAMLMMLIAATLMWLELRLESAPLAPAQSGWKLVNGMALRLTSSNPNLELHSPVFLKLELRNDSAKDLALRKQSSYRGGEIYRDFVEILNAQGQRIDEYVGGDFSGPVPSLTIGDFEIIKPGEVLAHEISMELKPNGDAEEMELETSGGSGGKHADVETEIISVRAGYIDSNKFWPEPTSIDVTKYDWLRHGKDEKGTALNASYEPWYGGGTTDAVAIRVHLPWTTQRIMKKAALIIGLAAAAGIAMEWLIRRREARKT